MERQRNRSRLRAYGRADEISPQRVPAAVVRAHLVWLKEQGAFGLERIADAAKVSRSLVLDVYFGRRGKDKRTIATEHTVSAKSAQRLMAITPEQLEAAFVPSTGTIRRLQALVAVGHSQTSLAALLGTRVTNLSHLILGHRPRVTAATYKATCQIFAELWAAHPVGGRADAARRLAKSRRWVGPLAWDDIDDPAEHPNLTGDAHNLSAGIDSKASKPAATDDVDEIAIELAIHGQRVRLTHDERREVVRRLHAQRWSDSRIAETAHFAEETAQRIRQELGLPVIPHGDQRQRGAA